MVKRAAPCSDLRLTTDYLHQAEQPGEGAHDKRFQNVRHLPSGRGIWGGAPIMEAAMRAWYRWRVIGLAIGLTAAGCMGI